MTYLCYIKREHTVPRHVLENKLRTKSTANAISNAINQLAYVSYAGIITEPRKLKLCSWNGTPTHKKYWVNVLYLWRLFFKFRQWSDLLYLANLWWCSNIWYWKCLSFGESWKYPVRKSVISPWVPTTNKMVIIITEILHSIF